MSDQRKGGIAWTEQTWNPIRGCSRVSAGCENCYAEKMAGRFCGEGEPYEGLIRITPKGRRVWNGKVRFVLERLEDPLRWRRQRMVFVNSMSDLFHEALSFSHIAAIFGVMAGAPEHTFQLLTKRPERMRQFFDWLPNGAAGITSYEACTIEANRALRRGGSDRRLDQHRYVSWPLANVWLGVSVEDQATADERIPTLLDCTAEVHWVSYEPALGAVDFYRWLTPAGSRIPPRRSLDWIVVGGESGPGARPFDVAWARATIEQCQGAEVACFVKQLGSRVVVGELDGLPFMHPKGGDMAEWANDLRVREMPR